MVKRNKHNTIVALVRRSGEHTTSLAQVAEESVSNFQELLGTMTLCNALPVRLKFGPVFTDEQQLDLAHDVTFEEIRKALLDIGNDKTPGPNGYGEKLFKAAWETIKTDLIATVIEFFGWLLKQ